MDASVTSSWRKMLHILSTFQFIRKETWLYESPTKLISFAKLFVFYLFIFLPVRSPIHTKYFFFSPYVEPNKYWKFYLYEKFMEKYATEIWKHRKIPHLTNLQRRKYFGVFTKRTEFVGGKLLPQLKKFIRRKSLQQ